MMSAATSLGAADDPCSVTKPPVPAFEPPPDEAPKITLAVGNVPQSSDRFWYGTPQLWTSLRRDGQIGRRDKMFWWSAGYRGNVEQRPNLVIAINRVGSGVSTIVDASPTNAHFDDAWSILTMFEFPEPGCWQVTGTYRGHRLSVVADIP
jgi:hypothetical protein